MSQKLFKVLGWMWAVGLVPMLYAHQQPTTLAMLDVSAGNVAMTLHIPVSELDLAFGHGLAQNPEKSVAANGQALESYIAGHIRPVAPGGARWTVSVKNLKVGSAEQTQSGPFQEVIAEVILTPPSGVSPRTFTLHYDLILHQVVTHRALVSIRSDWEGGRMEPVQAGVVQVDLGTATIAPLEIRLGEGGLWSGFAGMVRLGIQHIREGMDHLLFLIVLLLPATLRVNGGRWGEYGGARESLVRIVKIVTAFTIGHSITLLAGALHWLALPQQPVEVLIACSILVTAIHAVRPLFPGHEAQVAAGFGLVHGLAFATVLAELKLDAGQMALSILGFNVGIELMQLFVMALTVPWFVLLSLTPAHPWLRHIGAGLAGIAAVGWIVNRVSGESNGVERMMASFGEVAPLGILVLAFAAIPAYSYTVLRDRGALPLSRRTSK